MTDADAKQQVYPRPHQRSGSTSHISSQQTRRYASRSGILHHAVVDPTEPQGDNVERVVLVEPPRLLRTLLRHLRNGALHITRGEIERWLRGNRGIVIMRHALPEIVPVHVVDEPTDILAGEVAFQRP